MAGDNSQPHLVSGPVPDSVLMVEMVQTDVWARGVRACSVPRAPLHSLTADPPLKTATARPLLSLSLHHSLNLLHHALLPAGGGRGGTVGQREEGGGREGGREGVTTRPDIQYM